MRKGPLNLLRKNPNKKIKGDKKGATESFKLVLYMV